MAGSEYLLIDGGAKARRRGPRGQDVTPAQIETFLVTLGDTCNVARSARVAGFSQSWAYRLRKRDAGFRAGWAEAVREGYAKLELVLLERAMKGTPKPIMRRDGSVTIVRQYSTALAVALLRKHADAAAEAAFEHGEDELKEVRERILEKLERMRALDEADGLDTILIPLAGGDSPSPASIGEGVVQTKGIDRIGVILWGIRRQKALTLRTFGETPSPAGGRGRL